MADQQAEEQQAQPVYNELNFLKSPFPAPPPFWKQFTTDNLARLDNLSKNPDGLPPTLPFELAVLRPPPASSAGDYKTFDRPNQVQPRADPPPPEILLFDITSPRFNPAVMLTRLTKSLLLNFLELMTILTDNPAERTEKMEDIRRLVINVHAVINMYRPHQARESVKDRLEGMLEDGEREIEQCDAVKERVREFLGEVQGLKVGEQEGGRVVNELNVGAERGQVEDEQLREARRLWGMIHDIAGE